MKKIFLATGTVVSVALPISLVISCGEDQMNDYSQTKHSYFWGGEDRDDKTYITHYRNEYFILKMDVNVKIMDYDGFVNDIGKIKIFDGNQLISVEDIKKEITRKTGVNWANNSQKDKTWIKAYIKYIDDIYYYWNSEDIYHGSQHDAEWVLNKKTKMVFNQEKAKKARDNQYHEVRFISYKGVIFYDNLGTFKEIVYKIENQDQLDKLNEIFENMKKYPDVGQTNEYTNNNKILLKELKQSLGILVPVET